MRLAIVVLLSVVLTASSDVDQRLSRWRRVQMPFNSAGLSARERQLVEKLVDANRCLEDIYWRQVDPQGLELYKSTSDAHLRRLIWIQGGRFDLLEDYRPFVPGATRGETLYPAGLTRTEIERYVQAHPGKKAELYSSTTVVRRRGGELVGVPYRVEYKRFLDPASRLLREAAALSDDPALSNFLRSRAAALLSDDYYPSDVQWVDLKDPKIDIIFAPYETYLDFVLGVKGVFGGAVLIRNQAESRKLAVYQRYVPEIQKALPLDAADLPSKAGQPSPMEVMDAPFRSGDLNHGYQAVADNLPNDPRIHQEKGTKKIFFKNFMDARVQYILQPVAKGVMEPSQAAQVTGEGYLANTLLHEISHGLGPAWARRNGRQEDIRAAIGTTFSALEEAKADVVGMYGLEWLLAHQAVPASLRQSCNAAYLAEIFRALRFGTAEAHGLAVLMQFNYLAERGAIRRGADGRYRLDEAALPKHLAALSHELLEIEARGDAARADAWFARYGKVPASLKAALDSLGGIPVDIDPVFSFPENVQ